MVVILVLLTFAAFILIDWYLVTRRRKIMEAADQIHLANSPASVLFHPGHTWVQITPDGLVSVGASDFASNFAGDIARIELPDEGGRLRQGQPAWTLVSARDRRLTQVMPVDGEILAVNHGLDKDPARVQRDPYNAGWILRIRPRRLREALQSLLHGPAARIWLEAAKSRVTGRVGQAHGALAYDGGDWTPGFGDLLDDGEWEDLRRDLFPTSDVDRS